MSFIVIILLVILNQLLLFLVWNNFYTSFNKICLLMFYWV